MALVVEVVDGGSGTSVDGGATGASVDETEGDVAVVEDAVGSSSAVQALTHTIASATPPSRMPSRIDDESVIGR